MTVTLVGPAHTIWRAIFLVKGPLEAIPMYPILYQQLTAALRNLSVDEVLQPLPVRGMDGSLAYIRLGVTPIRS